MVGGGSIVDGLWWCYDRWMMVGGDAMIGVWWWSGDGWGVACLNGRS